MWAMYKGVIVAAVLSIPAIWLVTSHVVGMDTVLKVGERVVHRHVAVLVLAGRPRHHRPDRVDHRVLHRHRLSPGQGGGAGLGHRPRHQRHRGPRDVDGSHGAAGAADLRRHRDLLRAGRPVRHRHRHDRHAGARRHGGGARRLRPGHRQRRRHRRDGGPAEGSAQEHRRARRRRQHHQGGHQGLRHRLGGPRRAGAVRGLHLGPRLLHRPGQARRQGGQLLAAEPLRRGRPADRRRPAVPVRRHVDAGRRPRRAVGGRGGPPSVPREARHHGRARIVRITAAPSTCSPRRRSRR